MEDNKISWHCLTFLVFNEGHSMKCISGGDLLPGSTLVVFMEGVLGGLVGTVNWETALNSEKH